MRSSLFAVLLAACQHSQPAPEVQAPVVSDRPRAPITTDLGWQIDLTRVRLSLGELQFTIAGEMHASLGARLLALVEGTAYAHPGHYAGGEVTGELPGDHVTAFDGEPLGVARLIVGRYRGANFRFRRGLDGHTAELDGTATRTGRTITFHALVDIDDGAQLVGAPFDAEIGEPPPTLVLRLLAQSPTSPNTLFDKLDFAALDTDVDGHIEIRPGEDAHNLLRRSLQVHDHYEVTTE